MKPSSLIASSALATLGLLGAALPAAAGDLTVTVEGARSPEGSVLFALYDRADNFPSSDKLLQAQMASAAQPTAVFRGLPAGRYALAVFHDLNGNGKLDRNMFGMPTEPFGFSNNVMGVASAPSFDKAAVDLASDLAISIKLR